MAPTWPKMTQDSPKMAPRCPKMAQDGPKMAQHRSKMVPRWPKLAQDGVKMESTWPKTRTMTLKMRLKTGKVPFLRDVPSVFTTFPPQPGPKRAPSKPYDKPGLHGNGKRAWHRE